MHHIVELLVLHTLAQGDAPEREEGRQREPAVDLLVQVAGHEHGVLLLAEQQRVACGIADEKASITLEARIRISDIHERNRVSPNGRPLSTESFLPNKTSL